MGRVFASSDWHGCGNMADKVFDFLKEDDILYFIGDAIDRGPDGIKIMNKLLTDSRIIYMRGNHEAFMEGSIPYLIEGRYSNGSGLWLGVNGGDQTWAAMEHMSDESKMWYVNKIRQMPIEQVYTSPTGHSVILEHAGYSPFDIPHRSHDPLWDRDHFFDEWDCGFEKDNLDAETTYLVHGHTPIQYLRFSYGYKGQPATRDKDEMIIKHQFEKYGYTDWKPEVLRYCDGHKFDIDMCTIASGRIALLDLDTFETIYFDDDIKEAVI